jgi:hypothetical protein
MSKQRKRTPLDAVLNDAAETVSAPASAEVVELEANPKEKPRKEVVTTSLYLPRAVHRQVRELAFTEDSKPHALYLEALELLFKQRGLKSISELTEA